MDRAIILGALLEYCDHAKTRQECPVGNLCFK